MSIAIALTILKVVILLCLAGLCMELFRNILVGGISLITKVLHKLFGQRED